VEEIVFIVCRFEVIWFVNAMEGGEGIGFDQSQWELRIQKQPFQDLGHWER
jgi:hypothetical protein